MMIISNIMATKVQKAEGHGGKKERIMWFKKEMLFILGLIFDGYVAQLVRAQHS